ncbi:hypothetical protein ACKKBG_A37210 [Auxenochlorella protothecoides x Auxenochlorella symbiontica]
MHALRGAPFRASVISRHLAPALQARPESVAAMATAARSSLGRIALGDTALFVCDIQERFREAIQGFPAVVDVSRRMIRAAEVFQIPVIVTEQYPKALGKTVSELTEVLPKDAQVFEKTKFSMLIDEVSEFLTRRDDIKRILIVGIEAHVCVLQTTLELLDRGYEVHILTDAVSSRYALDRSTALHRLSKAGAILTTSETASFQLMGNTTYPNFKAISALFKEKKADSLPGL